MYRRVIPRDLFNEAKLLKCLGQLALLAHEGKLPRLVVDLLDDKEGFTIAQNDDDGSLFSANVAVTCNHRSVVVFSAYNSKKPYPLLFLDNQCEVLPVFDDDGNPSTEFVSYLAKLNERSV